MNGSRYPKEPKIDWFRVVVDLEAKRWSLQRIADAVERSKGWVSNLKNIPDTEPRFHDGLMLLGLWAQVTGKDFAAVEIQPAANRASLKGQEPARTAQETPMARISHLPQERHVHPQSERPDSRSADERPGAAFFRKPVFAA